jgi:Tfp pilus assembly protein PilN
MRITLNLAVAESARDRYALAWALPATIVGLALLVMLGRATDREYRAYQDVQRQVTEIQKHADELKKQEGDIRKKLEDPALGDLLRHAQFVNDLIDQKQFSVTDLAGRLADLLPDDVHLTGLAMSSKGGTFALRMGVAARSEDGLETFLNDLEDAPEFKDVSIINQGFQEDSAQAGQVNVILTARYLPGAN